MRDVLVPLAAGLLVFAGQWVVARYSRKANAETVEVQQDANAVAGFHQLVTDLQSDMRRLREDHESLRGKHGELEEHVRTLEQERRRDRSLIRHLIEYVHVLRDALRRLGQPIPEAPGGLDLDGGPLA